MIWIRLIKLKLQQFGFAIGICSLFCIVAMASLSMLRFREHLQWVVHTYMVIDLIQDVEMKLEQAEAGARGYLLIEDPRTLAIFTNAQENSVLLLSKLKQAVDDNPKQYENAETWEHSILARMELLKNLKREDLTSNKGLHLTDLSRIRDLGNVMRAEEEHLLELRDGDADSAARLALLLLSIGTLLTFSFLYLGRRTLKRALVSFRNQSILLRSIFESLGDGLMVVNTAGKAIHCNSAAEKLLGVNVSGHDESSRIQASAVINVATGKALLLEDSPLTRSLRENIMINNFETMTTRTMGEPRILSTDSRPVHDEGGKTVAALALFKDVTERKAIEREYRNAREDAIKASRLKSEFLANVSHEIRTPMNGVIGMTTLLLTTPLNPEQQEFVNTIQSSANSLLTLINQILDHAKIEQGKMELDEVDFDLRECVENVILMFRYLSRSKAIELELKVDDSLPEVVRGDGSRLRQVLINLVGNALKFTEGGFVCVKVEKGQEGEAIYFEVRDTGPGMSASTQSRLFEQFSQGGVEIQRKFGGSGLGLMISQKIIRQMGGTIGVESTLGLGSRFFFSLNLEQARGELALSATPAFEQGQERFQGRVLVAEDNVVNQKVIQRYLEMLGVDCKIVADGAAAVEAVKAQDFDLVLMDCRMTPVDGYAATRSIRSWENANGQSPIKIVAVTAEGRSGDRDLCFQAGMNDFITKPVEIGVLKRVFRENLTGGSTPEFKLSTLDKLASFKSGSSTLADEMIQEYKLSARKLCQQIRLGFREKNFQALSDGAHALKSISQTLGLEGLGAICDRMEHHPSLTNEQSLSDLENAFERGLDWLNDWLNRSSNQAA